jgi:hypothetical protein
LSSSSEFAPKTLYWTNIRETEELWLGCCTESYEVALGGLSFWPYEQSLCPPDVEATQTVEIIDFVSLDEVDPLLFYKPYYLEVGKGGRL